MTRLLTFFSIALVSINLNAQTLNVPTRDVNALEGSEVVTAINSLSLYDREVFIRGEVLSGNIPDFQRNLVAVVDSAFIGGSYKYITYYVLPDYLALGSDTNYFLCPMTPILAQQLADSLDCILPTRKMVNSIWFNADVQMAPQSIPPSPQMTTVPVFDNHNDMVWTQRSSFLPADYLGLLVAGDKKDVIISNLIYTSPPPARVVIYGWHYQNGTNIQPMYAGHIDTYADYSHGIRFIQNQCWIDGVPYLASNVLSSGSLYTLLSDEGVLSQPYYPDTSSVVAPIAPNTPKTFSLTNESANSVKLSIFPDANVDNYKVYSSADGLTFGLEGTYASDIITIGGLATEAIVYIRITASNSAGTSNQSEVLAAIPSVLQDSVLIVNGFDRNSTGNTKNFIRQHGIGVRTYGSGFSSATNDAVVAGMIDIDDYRVVDYILGEESTADETFSTSEQTIISNYLNQGGMLFVSGAEIGWDLSSQGSVNDKLFYNEYLKAAFVNDAPDGVSSLHYTFEEVQDSIFEGLGQTDFDDGSNGTYNVDYPDVINAINGAENGLYYSGLSNNYAGVYYHGLFPAGTTKGKLIHFGFPFEAVYPESKRNTLMEMVLSYFEDEVSNVDTSSSANYIDFERDFSFYPNPFTDNIQLNCVVKSANYELIDLSGKQVAFGNLAQGANSIQTSALEAGSYILRIETEGQYANYQLLKSQ